MKSPVVLPLIFILIFALPACKDSVTNYKQEKAKQEKTMQKETKRKEPDKQAEKPVYNKLKELPVDDNTWSRDYDNYFRKYSKRYFGPGLDWRWFKAQGVAESGLREDVKSWVGAKGIMQIMPKTFAEIQSKQSWIKDIDDPKWNIPGGIYYDQYLYKRWDIEKGAKDKMAFMFSSYNCGRGGTLRAQRKCLSDDCNLWKNVEQYTPEETRNYVKKIFTLMDESF